VNETHDSKIIILQGGKVMNSRKPFGTLLCAMLVLVAGAAMALGQNDPAAYRLVAGDAEESPAMNSETPVYQSPGGDCCGMGCSPSCCGQGCLQSTCCARWTATADYIVFDRVGSIDRTLVMAQPPSTMRVPPPVEFLNAKDLNQGFAGGPRVGLLRHGDCGYDLELLYFQIDGWSDTREIPQVGAYTEYFPVPGPLHIGNSRETMLFDYASRLYDAECNVRWNPICRLTMLAGFRYVSLQEDLSEGRLFTGASAATTFYPDWITNVRNDLYGFQVGADGLIYECGCFSIDGLCKAGVFGNHAVQSTIAVNTGPLTGSTTHTAFLGEAGVQCKYRVTRGLVLKAGYEALWLQGVALAPGQIDQTNVITGDAGINANYGAFYHGATAGLEYTF
jgi:hypothetical protein